MLPENKIDYDLMVLFSFQTTPQTWLSATIIW